VAKNTARESDDVFAHVSSVFSDAELVELTGICGMFALSNRFQDSMRLPIEEQHEVNKIRNSVRADTSRMKAFVAHMLDHWPAHFPVPRDADLDMRVTCPITVAPSALAARFAPAHASARVPLLDNGTAQPTAASYLQSVRALFGDVPNSALMWTHCVPAGKFLTAFHAALMFSGIGSTLPPAVKIAALVRTSRANRSPYSMAHGIAMASAAGISDAKTAEILCTDNTALGMLEPRLGALLNWADHVAANTAKHHDDIFDTLKVHFDDTGIVELTALCATANMFDRVENALRLPVESQPVLARLYRSLNLAPEKLKNYVQQLLDTWPSNFPSPVD